MGGWRSSAPDIVTNFYDLLGRESCADDLNESPFAYWR
jgi:hypothetical protein